MIPRKEQITSNKTPCIILNREKRVLERQVRAQLQMPNRKDRAEIDGLKATIESQKIMIQRKGLALKKI